jgi:hypothetical protein
MPLKAASYVLLYGTGKSFATHNDSESRKHDLLGVV